ncbi:FecR family protein [Pseudomonas alliivorans]|uniref:FecR family protein n=1 Tax=Pseudomonas alliivorans TaxID=2810613 RepID=A0ABS4CDE3_9PSED|nr:FecR family protein [Pseudomonas alliivorans]MBP0948669.1 FecR family protein [Pseudomonas alliivorans]MEE4329078.1 FecR family protein [Pseudomonas alliivorans]MEE4369956.1 FecR family protein [Pseudomonas alliivorans]
MNLNSESLNKSDISPAVAQQAVGWLLEMQEGSLTAGRQKAWQLWLNGNVEHQRAWAHIQRVNQRLGGLSSPLAHAALGAPKSGSRRHALKLLLLLGAGSVAGWSLRDQIALQPLLADYNSGVGEQRKVALSDGSQIQLNTASAVDVKFDARQRLIRLLSGEMLMTASADTRPLNLLTAEGSVKVVTGDSRFNLRQLNGRTQLAVFAGAVELTPDEHAGSGLTLQAQQQITFSRNAWDSVRPVDATSGAWADGMLVASRMKLTDFLDELGRYRRGRLNCDAKVANLLISGSYPLADSERILDMLELALPVRVQRFTRYWINVQARV